MSRARNMATLLDAGGDVLASALDNAIGGGPSLGTNSVIRTNAKVIDENITFTGSENGQTTGPITVNAGKTVLVASGSTWVVL